MKREIVVDVGPRERRVGIVEDGRLVELKVERETKVVGNVYKGRVENVVPGLDAAFVDIGLDRNAFLHVSDAVPEDDGPGKRPSRRYRQYPPVRQVLKDKQEVLVQVTKGPIGSKGARVTTHVSLPGRFVVVMGPQGKRVGVSRKIEDEEERKRLRAIGEKLRPDGYGLIMRTQAEGADQRELGQDVEMLMRMWRKLLADYEHATAPALLHEDLSLIFSILRDVFAEDFDAFVINDRETFTKVQRVLDDMDSSLKGRVRLFEGKKPIFEHFGIEKDVERAMRPKVWLPHGGYINIDPTEALTVIDVNTGKFTDTARLADTVFQTNLEAVDEIARQLRLRDIGGIIVVDFIDMDKRKHRHEVMAALRNAFKRDRMKTRIVHLTPLGLVEMTRKRTGDSLSERLHEKCPYCGGAGKVLTPESVSIQIEKELRRLASDKNTAVMVVEANPQVVLNLLGEEGEYVRELEETLGKPIYVRASARLHAEAYEVAASTQEDVDRRLEQFVPGQKVHLKPEDFVALEGSDRRVAFADGYAIDLPEGTPLPTRSMAVRLVEAGHSHAKAEVLVAE
jgi:ribonuclease G